MLIMSYWHVHIGGNLFANMGAILSKTVLSFD